MKKIVIKILQILAKMIVKKYNPKIVAITGSVGKTTTKEACFAVLKTKFNVRCNKGNYNTEIGLPLTIIGHEGGLGKNIFKWKILFLRALSFLIVKRKYPDILVLEMGADKPGDISELLKIVSPNVGIITAISATHIEQFKNIAGVIREKGKLFRAVERDGWIIVNSDREEVVDIADKCDAKKAYIGICNNSGTSVCASEVAVSISEDAAIQISGLSFKLHSKGNVTPVLLKGVIGDHQVYPALFAASCGQIFGINMIDIAEGLRKMRVQPGRMRLIDGIKRTVIIDDTYNSSPTAAQKAIETLSSLEIGNKKYAVLGDMLELGSLTEEEHLNLGKIVAKQGIDYLITVGERAKDISKGALQAKMDKDLIFEFDDTKSAGLFIQNRLEEGDIILVKGSRGMQMQNIVREIMMEPERARELLVR